MKNTIMVIKVSAAGICTFIIERLKIVWPMLSLLILLMLLDYISGLLASKRETLFYPHNNKYGWNSKKGIVGIYKKVGYILTIIVALGTDYVLLYFIQGERNTVFGLLVIIWFVVNELISILENVGRMGVKLPAVIIKTLSELKKDIGNKSE